MYFKIGQRIECLDNYRGEVAFIGKLKGRDSLYVGIRLDKPIGRNSGMYAGERYFIAKKNHGIFVKYEHLEELERTNKIIEENMNLVPGGISKVSPLSLDKAAKILASNKDDTIYMDTTSLDINNQLEKEENISISKNFSSFLKQNRIDFTKKEPVKKENIKNTKPLTKHERAKEYDKTVKERNKLKEYSEYLKEDSSLIENSEKTFEESLHINNLNFSKINTNNSENNQNKSSNFESNYKFNNDISKFSDQKEFLHHNPRKMEEELRMFRDSKKSIETINDNMRSVQRDLEEAERGLKEEIRKRKGLEEMVRNRVSSVLYNMKNTLRELKECFTKIHGCKIKEKGDLYFLLMNIVNSLEKRDVNSVNKNLELFKKVVGKKGIEV